MNYTLVDLSSSILAFCAFGAFLLPPAFLFAHWTDLVQFRERSRAEGLLWVTALALPLSLFLSAILGRFVPAPVISALYLVAALWTAAMIVPRIWRDRFSLWQVARHHRVVLCALLAFAGYVLLITTSIEVHGHLYESVNFTDWSVRLPMVSGAMRDGVPPGNPFFTVNGQPEPSRYYYYWYVLCAAVGRPLHLSARACLSASAFWSGLGLIAVLYLMLKHLVRYTAKTSRESLLPLLLSCVMGVDVVVAVLGYCLHPPVIFPEIEWWLDDRIPSFMGAVIFAPHHVAGVVCCAVGFLVMFMSRQEMPGESEGRRRWKVPVLAAVTAGICLAASAGDSTFVAFCFAVAGCVYAIDLVRTKRWSDLGVLCGAGVLALLFSLPFLHDLLARTPGLPAEHHRILEFELRNRREKEHFAGTLVFKAGDGFIRDTLYMTIGPLLLILQFGFLLVPLLLQLTRDGKRLWARQPFSDGERFLWAIFLGAALPGFLLSSAPEGVNDLGRHAGLILRLALVVWAVPLLWPYFQRWREHKKISPEHPWWARAAVALFVLSLISQFWQITVSRGLLPFLAHRPRLIAAAPLAHEADSGARFFQLRRGLSQVEAQLPANAVVQSNMGGPFQQLVMFYSSHPFAAGDPTCVPSFGGDERKCVAMMQDLHTLFYTSPDIPYWARVPYHRKPALNPALAGPAIFFKACADEKLAAVVVQNSDLAWTVPTSWVWQLRPLYAASLVRIFGCPAYFPGSAVPVQAATNNDAAHGPVQ